MSGRRRSAAVHDLVVGHYSGEDLSARILAALQRAGRDLDHLRVEDLAPVDQLHAGGAPATGHVLDALPLRAGTRLLDVGSGIGGPARLAGARLRDLGGSVTGVDLTPGFVAAARALTAAVGLDPQVRFEVTDGARLPLDDAAFDAAMMIHVGMNVPDKTALFTEVRRALVDGSTFVIYDQMRTGDGRPTFPMPWAVDERSSFVEDAHEYAAHLVDAGFEVVDVQDRTAAAGPPPPPEDGLSMEVLFGPEFVARIGNNVAATQRGELGAVQVVARAA